MAARRDLAGAAAARRALTGDDGVERLYGMNAIAAREGFIAVNPNGTAIGKLLLRQRRTWNAGACCGPAADNDVDDVALPRRR